jgi:hypothetical protein
VAEPAHADADACCRGCGQPLPPPVRRRADRRGLCRTCRRLRVATCSLCGIERLCRFAAMAHPVCRYCVPERTRECAACGQHKRMAAATERGLICSDCARYAARGRPRCRDCRRANFPAAWVGGAPLCSQCAGIKYPISNCAHCGEPRTRWRGRLCPPCALADSLDRLRAAGDPAAVARLAPFLDSLKRHGHPTTVIGWLVRSRGAPVLRAMIAGEIPVSHEALDQHDVGQATAYLRSWLVAEAVLEPREELLARFDRWAQRALQALGEHPDRTPVAAYARWKLSPDLARKLRRGQARASTHKAFHAKLRDAISFTRSLHERGLTLQDARQAHVDAWVAAHPSRAVPTRAFLDWAHHAGLIPRLHVPRTPPRTTNPPIDHATRVELARSLLSDDTIELPIRIAGTLLLLYGQLITRVARLRTHDVIADPAGVRLRLGQQPIEVTGAFAELLRRQRATAPGEWLFPGAKPGTHLGPERICRRLRELGIYPETARPGALLALAASVPAPVLAELLGFHDDTANRWRRSAGGDWARYASLASTPTT